ncbi:MAG: hypothetical protein HYZ53_20105 [Planctomycetes bacterium]|nr:hypothetical protein [Planctomycetota bacterium]
MTIPPIEHGSPRADARGGARRRRPVLPRALAGALLLLSSLASTLSLHAQDAPLEVVLMAPGGDELVRGGVPYEVRWSVTGAAGTFVATLEFSDDDGFTWNPASGPLPGASFCSWITPRKTAGKCRLRVRVRDAAKAEAAGEIARSFAIDASAPVACVKGLARRTPLPAIAYEAVDRGAAGVAALELWIRPVRPTPTPAPLPAGARWERGPDVEPGATEVDFSPEDGTYDLYLYAEDKVGNATPRPDATTIPQATVLIDKHPPSLEILKPRPGDALRGGSEYKVAWKAADAHLLPESVRLEFSRDDGLNWEILARGMGTAGETPWRVPAMDLARARLRLAAFDQLGHRADSVVPLRFAIDASPPAVSVTVPRSSKLGRIPVHVQLADAGPAGVAGVAAWDLYATEDEGRSWTRSGRYTGDDTSVVVEAPDGLYGFAASAVDHAGNRSRPPDPGDAPRAVCRVDSKDPVLEFRGLAEGTLLKAGVRPHVAWDVRDAGLPSRPVHFEISDDDGRSFAPLRTPDVSLGEADLALPARSGKYLLRVSAVDLAGNSVHLERALVLDGQCPHVSLASFDDSAPLAGGSERELRWEAADEHLGPNPVTLLFSRDFGKTWTPLARDLPNTGRYAWRVPRIASQDCVVRVVVVDQAGNLGEAVSSSAFTILTQGLVPRALHTPPVNRTGKVTLSIAFEADERSVLRDVELWTTQDAGHTWRMLRRCEPAELPDVTLDLPEGEHGLVAVATDVAGNRAAEPAADTAPSLSVLVDAKAPEVRLVSPVGPQTVRGGDPLALSWVALDSHLANTPCSVEVAKVGADGQAEPWETVAGHLPWSGEYAWRAPAEDGAFLVRVRAVDRAGNEGSAELPVRIVATAPALSLEPLSSSFLPGGRDTVVRWSAKGGTLGDRPARLELSIDGGGAWRAVAESLPAAGEAAVRLPVTTVAGCLLRVVLTDALGSRTEALSAPFTISSEVPSAVLPELGCVATHVLSLRPILRLGALAPLAHTELWGSADRGRTWKELARGKEDPTEPIPCELADGAWLLYARPVDAAGNAPPRPQDWLLGFASVTVDATPPEISFEGIENGDCRTPGSTAVLAWAVKDANPGPAGSVELASTVDGGATWTAVATGLGARDSWRGRLPRDVAAVTYRLTARDGAGNVVTRSIDLTLREQPLVVEARASVAAGECVRGGEPVVLEWRYVDGGPELEKNPVVASARVGEGPWLVLAEAQPRVGRHSWKLPEESAEAVEVRLEAVDADGGRVEFLAPVRFRVDAEAPRVAVREPLPLRERAGFVEFAVTDAGGAGADHVDLWVADDKGRDWHKRHTALASAGRVAFDAPDDGRFGIRLIGVDAVGNAAPPPVDGEAPQAIVLVDSVLPVVSLKTLVGGETLAAGAETELRWSASDDRLLPDGIRLEVSADGGLTWELLAGGLPNHGAYRFRLPERAGASYRFRVLAEDQVGNVGEAASVADLAVDSTVPEGALAALERPITGAREITCAYETRPMPGRVFVARVHLWATEDGGRTWTRVATAAAGAPLVFRPAHEGTYGLHLTCESSVAIRGNDPVPGTEPERTLAVDWTAPAVKLAASAWDDGFVGAGALDLGWTLVDADPHTGAVIEISADNARTWTPVENRSERQWTGRVVLPAMAPGTPVRMRVKCTDGAGNIGLAETPRSAVYDPTPPAVRFTGFEAACRAPAVGLLWEATDAESGVARVWARWRHPGTEGWNSNEGFMPRGSPMILSLPDGRWEFQLMAADRAGNRTPESAPSKPDASLLVDSVPPKLTRVTAPERLVLGATRMEVRWETDEANPLPNSIVVEASADDGRTWSVLASDLPDFGRAEVPTPATAGTYRLRVRARDEAGNEGVSDPTGPMYVPGGR